jgi:hypothetical protein
MINALLLMGLLSQADIGIKQEPPAELLLTNSAIFWYPPTNTIKITLTTNTAIRWFDFMATTNQTKQLGLDITNRVLEIVREGNTNVIIVDAIGFAEKPEHVKTLPK